MPQAGGREEWRGLTKSERFLATISPMDLLFTLCPALKQPTGDGGGTDEQTDCCRRRCPHVTSRLFLGYPSLLFIPQVAGVWQVTTRQTPSYSV